MTPLSWTKSPWPTFSPPWSRERTARSITERYLERIEALDRQGPGLGAAYFRGDRGDQRVERPGAGSAGIPTRLTGIPAGRAPGLERAHAVAYLRIAYAYEQATRHQRAPSFAETLG